VSGLPAGNVRTKFRRMAGSYGSAACPEGRKTLAGGRCNLDFFAFTRLSAAAIVMAALAACNTSTSGLDTGSGKSARELAAIDRQAVDAETTGKVEHRKAPVEQPPAEEVNTSKVAAIEAPAESKPALTEAAATTEKDTAITEKAVVEKTETVAKKDEAAKTETANVIRQQNSVAQRGTYIRALVNGEPITNYDIQRRMKFRQLRKERGGEQATLDELVDEHLKMQEARRLNAVASDAQVNEAFDNFARSNKASPSQISGELDKMGIGATQFKNYIRTQISWRRTVGVTLRSETVGKSQSEAIFELRKAGEQKPTLTEYRLQQIIFVIPADRRKALMAARKNEAQNFRQKFTDCQGTVELAKALRDVAVKNLGLMFEPEIPPEWKDEVTSLAIGETTKPKETDKGVEILAVCDAHVSADDRAAQVSAQVQTIGDLETKGDEEADKLLAELRKNATIIYR
jgi:peptidyl-prolyl cis-trans isomerase SurA